MKRANYSKIIVLVLTIIILASFFVACSDLNTSTQSSKNTIVFKIPVDPNDLSKDWVRYSGLVFKGNNILKFPNDPKKADFVFDGWYDDELFTNEVFEYSYLETDVFPNTLYAKFISPNLVKNEYNVSFETYIDPIAGKKVAFREKIAAPQNLEKKGYTLEGWYLDADFNKKWNFDYDRVKADITLYAKWEIKEYKINFKNLKESECTQPLQTKYDVLTDIVLPDFSSINRAGYSIEVEKYYLDENYTIEYDATKKYYEDLSIYIKWKAIEYTIEYIVDESVTFDSTHESIPKVFNLQDKIKIPKEKLPKKEGYEFMGFTYELDGQTEYLSHVYETIDGIEYLYIKNPPAQNIQLKSYFDQKKINIVYNLNGGELDSSGPYYYFYFDETITLLTPKKSGYEFLGWFKDEALTQEFDNVNTREIIIVYAKWALKTYSINYEFNGGEAPSTSNPTEYNVDNKNYQNINNIPTRNGYKFTRWYLNAAQTEAFDKTKDYNCDLTLYAGWAEDALINIASYTVYANTHSIFVDTNQTKNVAIQFDDNDAIVSASIGIDNYAAYKDDQRNILVIKKSYLDAFGVGYKVECDVIFESNKKDTYYFTLINSTDKTVEAQDFIKGTSNTFDINTTNITSVNAVTIDEKYIEEFSFIDNKISIDKKYLANLSVKNHTCQVFAQNQILSDTFKVSSAENVKYYPYDVKIDIDSSYPNVYVTWKCDAQVDKFSVVIAGETYETQETIFDATNILKIKDQSCLVKAHVEDNVYEANVVKMPQSLFASSTSTSNSEMAGKIFGYPQDNGFTFYGKANNYYFTSLKEFKDAIFYSILYPEKLSGRNIRYTNNGVEEEGYFYCFNYLLDFDIHNEEIDLEQAAEKGAYNSSLTQPLDDPKFVIWLISYTISILPEASSIIYLNMERDFANLTNVGAYEFAIQVKSATTPETIRSENINSGYSQAQYSVKHFGQGIIDENYKFPRELNNKGEAIVDSSIELYIALENGYYPKVNPSNTNLYNMYRFMKSQLKSIIDESMTDFEIALAIYDYLEAQVIYDYDALEQAQILKGTPDYIDMYGYSSFYMEGVFIHGYAVCNGIAAAYTSMLNLMGIESYKVGGLSVQEQAGVTVTEDHAWVKMKIGGLWYLSDPTWSNSLSYKNFINASGGKVESVDYRYFMIPYDVSFEQGRQITNVSLNEKGYEGDFYIDVYKMIEYKYGGNSYSHVIKNRNDASNIVNSMVSQYGDSLQSGESVVICVRIDGDFTTCLSLSVTDYVIRRVGADNSPYQKIFITKS